MISTEKKKKKIKLLFRNSKWPPPAYFRDWLQWAHHSGPCMGTIVIRMENIPKLYTYGCFSEKGYHMGWPDSKTNYKFVIHPLEEIPITSWLLNMWEITIITTKVFHVVVLVWKPIFVCQMWRFSIAILWHEPATIKQLTRIPTTLSYFHCKHFIY